MTDKAEELLSSIRAMISGDFAESTNALEKDHVSFEEKELAERIEKQDHFLESPSFVLSEQLPLVNVVFLLFLEGDSEQHILEQTYQLMAITDENFLKTNYETLINESDPRPKALLDYAMQCLKTGNIMLAKDCDLDERNLSFSMVDSLDFLKWAERQGIVVNERIVCAAKMTIELKNSRERAERELETRLPQLKDTEVCQLKREPLWVVRNAILYALNRGCNTTNDEVDKFLSSNPVASKLRDYVYDAVDAGDLALIKGQRPVTDVTEYLNLKVRPGEFLIWAENLPLDLPISQLDEEGKYTDRHKKYLTPEMKLMLDAVEKFWSEYDLENPDPSKAPYKKDVVAWLIQEAKNRGLTDFSKSRAEYIDTLIRCPKSRQGGNTR